MLNRASNFDRVFFHELGHFVAHIIGERRHDGLGISEFSLTRKYDNEFEGRVKPIPFEGWVKGTPPPLERLVQTILILEHGCLFEAYFLQEHNIKNCANCHGQGDFSLRRNMLGHHSKLCYKEQLSTLTHSYLQQLIDTKGLDKFLILNPKEFILGGSVEESIIFDHAKLQRSIEPFIESYEVLYEEQYRALTELLQIESEQ